MNQILSKFDNFGVVGKLTTRSIQIWQNQIEQKPQIICQNRKFGFRVKDPKFGFELGLRISNFRFSPKFKNLTKKQNSATVVYHNFAISPKFAKSKFSTKLVRILANNPYKIFPKFWSRYQNPKITKIGSHRLQNFVRKIL